MKFCMVVTNQSGGLPGFKVDYYLFRDQFKKDYFTKINRIIRSVLKMSFDFHIILGYVLIMMPIVDEKDHFCIHLKKSPF